MLSPSARQVTHALLTRPPLKQKSLGFILFPFDLHVLGTPPAFILSQDQTLMLKVLSCQLLSGITVFRFCSLKYTSQSPRPFGPVLCFKNFQGCIAVYLSRSWELMLQLVLRTAALFCYHCDSFISLPHTFFVVNTFLEIFLHFFQSLSCRIKFHPHMEFNPANLLPFNSGI